MLEHLGAYGIDADALGHRAIARGAPGYKPVVTSFGTWILGPDGEINRAKLARVVFGNPDALALLEGIVHPLVSQAIDLLVRRSRQKVVAIEAIKLLEAKIHKNCDSIWVTYAPPEIQLVRLIQKRRMTESEARQRINSQNPQEQKIAAANVVIRNISSFEDTWKQVNSAWKRSVPEAQQVEPAEQKRIPDSQMMIVRARPRHSEEIASLYNRLLKSAHNYDGADIMAAFGEKAFLLLKIERQVMGIVGWQVENLVARTTDVLLDPSVSAETALPILIKEMELASKDLQCEASLVFVPPKLAQDAALWSNLGYEERTVHNLGVLAWQEAAEESMPAGSALFFKQLRKDRVLRPI